MAFHKNRDKYGKLGPNPSAKNGPVHSFWEQCSRAPPLFPPLVTALNPLPALNSLPALRRFKLEVVLGLVSGQTT